MTIYSRAFGFWKCRIRFAPPFRATASGMALGTDATLSSSPPRPRAPTPNGGWYEGVWDQRTPIENRRARPPPFAVPSAALKTVCIFFRKTRRGSLEPASGHSGLSYTPEGPEIFVGSRCRGYMKVVKTQRRNRAPQTLRARGAIALSVHLQEDWTHGASGNWHLCSLVSPTSVSGSCLSALWSPRNRGPDKHPGKPGRSPTVATSSEPASDRPRAGLSLIFLFSTISYSLPLLPVSREAVLPVFGPGFTPWS